MPTETAPTEVKPTDTPPPATPKPGEAADPNAGRDLVPELMKNLLQDVPAEETLEAKKKKDDDAKAEAEKTRLAEEAKKKAPPATPEKPITVRKKPREQRPPLPTEVTPPPPPAARATETKVDAPDDSDLEEEERQSIADAEEAEKLFPDKHKGLVAKTRKYIRDHIDFINKHGGDAEFDPENPQYADEYRRFIDANRPQLTPLQQREINETRIANQVVERTRPEVERLKDERFRDQQEPQARAVAKAAYDELVRIVTPKEIQEDIKARGWDAASKDYKLELDVINAEVVKICDDILEYERLTRFNPETNRPLSLVATDRNDPKFAQHQRLTQMVNDISENFKKNAPMDQQKRDGKWFVTKNEWLEIKKVRPDTLGQFWTFSNREIINFAKKGVPAIVSAAIARKLKEQEDLGFFRKPREVKKEPVVPVKGAPPAPHPTPAPAGDPGGAAPSGDVGKILANFSKG